jgi:hypothetical protein
LGRSDKEIVMKRTVAVIAACTFAASSAAFAEDAHHPEETKQAPPAAAVNPAAPAMGSMGMHDHMKLMQDQMGKIRSASDPKEKERLMNEHMKTMEQSMSMMKGMMNCGGM